jgi:hypothetical protein
MLVAAFPYTLFKVDQAGAVSWAEQIGWPYEEDMTRITGIVARPDGGFVTAGIIEDARPATFEEMDTFIGRFDAAGVPVWTRRLGATAMGETTRALVPFAGGSMMLGSTWNPTGAFWTAFLARLDGDGEIVWAKNLRTSDGTEDLRAFLLTGYESADGDFIAAGTVDYGSRGCTLVVKVKPDGTIAWSSSEDVPDSYTGITVTGIAPLPTSGMVATGRFSNSQSSDLWFAGLDSVGRVQWMKRLGRTGGGGPLGTDPGAHNAPGVAVGLDGGMLVVGYTEGLATGADTDGFLALQAYAKDGSLTLSGSAATISTTAAAAVPVTVSAVAWNPTTTAMDAPLTSVTLTATALNVPTTRLAP